MPRFFVTRSSGLIAGLLMMPLAKSLEAIEVSGTVRTHDGEPVAAALVTFINELDPSESFSDVTDENGVYRIPGLRPTAVENRDSTPTAFALHQNHPNPFNSSTVIPYSLPQPGHVQIEIFNNLGQHVRTLLNTQMTAGHHSVRWDGRNATQEGAGAGVYLYRIITSQATETKKMTLVDGAPRLTVSPAPRSMIDATSPTYKVVITADDFLSFEQLGVVVGDSPIAIDFRLESVIDTDFLVLDEILFIAADDSAATVLTILPDGSWAAYTEASDSSESSSLVLFPPDEGQPVSVSFDQSGRPVMAVTGDVIILFENYDQGVVDMAVIGPDTTFHVERAISLAPIEELPSAGKAALRQASSTFDQWVLDGKATDLNGDGRIDHADFTRYTQAKFKVEAIGDALKIWGATTCAVGILGTVLLPNPISASLLLGCLATAVSFTDLSSLKAGFEVHKAKERYRKIRGGKGLSKADLLKLLLGLVAEREKLDLQLVLFSARLRSMAKERLRQIDVAPQSVTLFTGQMFQFSTSTGEASIEAVWVVEEGAAGGVIDATGLYTAPPNTGTYHVVATPVNPNRAPAVATVEVIGVVITPSNPTINVFESILLQANVEMTWRLTNLRDRASVTPEGTPSATAHFTATNWNAVFTVEGTPIDDRIPSATVTIEVVCPQPVVASTDPDPLVFHPVARRWGFTTPTYHEFSVVGKHLWGAWLEDNGGRNHPEVSESGERLSVSFELGTNGWPTAFASRGTYDDQVFTGALPVRTFCGETSIPFQACLMPNVLRVPMVHSRHDTLEFGENPPGGEYSISFSPPALHTDQSAFNYPPEGPRLRIPVEVVGSRNEEVAITLSNRCGEETASVFVCLPPEITEVTPSPIVLSRSQVQQGTADVTLTITGRRFGPDASVTVQGVRTVQDVSASVASQTSATVTFPANDRFDAPLYGVTVAISCGLRSTIEVPVEYTD